MPALHAAIATPLDEHGKLNKLAFAQLIRHLEARGLDGIVPCGTTGEGPSFSVAERLEIIVTAISQRGSLKVIAGTGCQSLADTISLTNAAIQAGADSALVLPPFFYKQAGEAGVIAWYRAVCDALPIGGRIVLYHIPPMTGVPITPTVIDALLSSHAQSIEGIKDSAVDAAHTQMLCSRYPQLNIYTGNAPLLGQAINDGAAGSILAIANIVPKSLRQLTDHPDRHEIQHQVAQVDAYVRKAGAVATIKAILNQTENLTLGRPCLPQLPHPNHVQAYAEFKAIGTYTE
ncbi:MAG: dihydrodipicolinate synthase family protein [Chloroflexi bacterium]|nr:dihydrodipicolinate synthase family protein [Chloroflexota bacterium]